MQNRYAGDIGDFAKYGLLRAIGTGKRLGVAWYLRPDEDSRGDGRHTEYLSLPNQFKHLDPDLFAAMKTLRVDSESWSVADVVKSGILGSATFVDEPLCIENVNLPDRGRWRQDWFQQVQEQLAGCDLVLADPDNGLFPDESFNPARKENTKRLPLDEAKRLAEPGRTLVIYHHNTRARPHREEILWWMSQLPGCAHAFYWKRWSCRTFFIVNPDRAIEERLEQFVHKWRACGKLIRNPMPDKPLKTMIHRN